TVVRRADVKAFSSAATFWLFVAALTVILVLYYRAYLADQASFFIYDLYAGWHPYLSFTGECLRAGRMPLWDPYALNGIPAIAVIAPTVFYPLYLLFGALPFNPAFALLLVSQQLIAGIGMYLLVRSFNWGKWA